MSDPIESLTARRWRAKLYSTLGDFSIAPIVAKSARDSLDLINTQYSTMGDEAKSSKNGASGGFIDGSYGVNRNDYRARAKIIRYARHNDLDRLGTLTFASPVLEFSEVRSEYYQFTRRLKRHLGYIPPYLGVPEQHRSGAYHVQIVQGFYIPKNTLEGLWGRGFTEIRRLRAVKGRSASEGAGRYAAKSAGGYSAKSVGETVRPAGAARFWQTQGFAPKPMIFELDGESAYDVLRVLRESAVVGEPSWIGSYDDVPLTIVGRSEVLPSIAHGVAVAAFLSGSCHKLAA